MNHTKDLIKKIPGMRGAYSRIRNLQGSQEIHPGPKSIIQNGHRAYVGSLWEQIGNLQFEFLVAEGLRPHHFFLDIACGCLRGGVHFIPFLDKGHYLGIEKERSLIRRGIIFELGIIQYLMKKPRLVVSHKFEFDQFDVQPDYALAQSLFTHLPESLINTCFKKLHQFIRKDGVFYATFFETETDITNPSKPNDHGYFAYTQLQMKRFGNENGWATEYIGNWNHPRKQVMVRYHPV